MANTIRAAKNTFNGGLVMDLAPDTTPNEVLTSALNATLVTFNGNELLLQNDMGNGRVETARLPEGYIPVGTCEFGDIIYIVSYNPLTNRSQIGCFPSPERNISSEEVGSNNQQLSSADFQEGTGAGENFVPNGELKASSVKKIIYNNKMNPGDKYVIYDNNNVILDEKHITDIGNASHIYGTFPKLLKIHVVAIEDGGKINYLDSTVRWYDKTVTLTIDNEDVYYYYDYFMMSSTKTLGNPATPDIDSYRDLLSSGYSVFQSKISGKLALLIELERFNGFSCTYNTYTSQKPIETSVNGVSYRNKKCKIYWNVNWNTEDDNINPKYIVLTKSEWKSKQPGEAPGHYYLWSEHNPSAITDESLDIQNIAATADIEVNAESAIPVAFPGTNYYFAEISRLYNMSAENISYSSFISDESYEKKLENRLNDIRNANNSPYAGRELYKLNLSRKDVEESGYKYIGLPRDNGNESYYFINLTSIERNSSAEGNGSTLYTGYISDFEDEEGKILVSDYTLSDDIVNNYFHTSVTKFFYTFDIPVEQQIGNNVYTPDISNLIYHYEITPAMDYGLLREYSVEGYIDFSKIGTGAIDLTHWKYYNAENISTLTLGLDAYVEENKGIAEVALEFYDNQGYAATYHIRDKESYSGVFTEVIPLNGATQSINLDAYDAAGEKHTHLGPSATDFAKNVGYNSGGFQPLYYKQVNGEVKAYEDKNYNTEHTSKDDLVINDAGVIYGNAIYLVKIIVKYCQKDVLGNLDTTLDSEFKTYYRWYWTNTAFNEHYSNVNDFDVLQPSLTVDANVAYEMDNSGYQDPQGDAPSGDKTDYQDLQKSAGLTIQKMTDQKIKVCVSPYLYNNYNTFKLLGNKGEGVTPTGVYAGLNLKICRGKRYIEQYLPNGSKEPPIQIHTGEYSTSMYTEWEGMKFVPGDTESTDSMLPYHVNWRDPVQEGVEGGGGYETLTDDFRVEFTSEGSSYTSDPPGIYIGKDSLYIKKDNYPEKSYGANAIDDGIDVFNLNLLHYSKYYIISDTISKNATAVSPLIKTVDDLAKYNLGLDTSNNLYVKTHVTILVTGQGHSSGDVKFCYRNALNDTEGPHFWVDHDVDYLLTVDVWDVDNVGNKTCKGTFLDYWFAIGTCLLSQFNYDNNKTFYHRQNGGQDGEGGITGHSIENKNNNLTDGDNCLMSPGFFTYNFYQSKPGSSCANGYYEGWVGFSNNLGNAIDLNPTPDIQLSRYTYGLGFVDKDHNMHLFNTWYYGSTSHKLLSLLTQLYVLDGASTLSVLSSLDIVYLQDNYTLYTLDVVYEYYSNNSLKDNLMITIYDYNYINYISTLLNQVGASNYILNSKFTDTTVNNVKISMNNVNITLKYSSRNVPLEFKMDYKRPSTFAALEQDETKALLKTILDPQGKLVTPIDPINNTTLYQFVKEENSLKEVDGGFKFLESYVADVQSGNLVLNLYNGTNNASKFYQVFKYSGDYLEFVNKEYSSANSYWSVGQTYKGFTGTIADLLKKDVLVDGYELIS